MSCDDVRLGSDHVARNREFWDRLSPAAGEFGDQHLHGRQRWAAPEPRWGDWSVPESTLHVLPAPLGDLDTLELGCGTAYISSWLARAGARPVGLDVSARQLRIARDLQGEYGMRFPLVLGDAEAVELPDASFDLVISEYGASVFCVPDGWIAETRRLLRPGGWLIFLAIGPISGICMSEDDTGVGERLTRSYFSMAEPRTGSDGTVEFQLPYGGWVRVLRRHGFVIEDLIEIQAPAGSRSPWPYVSPQWARRWPSEIIWKARRPG